MRKVISLMFIMVLISFVSITVYADGMTFGVDRGISKLLNEEHQFCAISYKDGYQNMILSINTEKSTFKNGVWLFPVPAKPESVKLNVVKGFPEFYGEDMKETGKRGISDAFDYMRLSQLYPAFYLMVSGGILSSPKGGHDVKIYNSINKMGVSTEVISASDITGLSEYLEKKGMKIESSYRATLNSYLGKDYSFVVSFINDESKITEEQNADNYHERSAIDNLIGVNIVFPSNKLFFPLKPTSVYGERIIPAVIYIEGFVTPDIFKDIDPYTKVSYYKGGISNSDSINKNNNFFESTNNTINYTKIEINSSAKLLTDDLWIEQTVPVKVKIYENINNNPISNIIFIVLFIIISCISGLISGIISFKGYDIPKYKFIVLGLCNIFSIVGLSIASFRLKLGEVGKETIKSIKNSDDLRLKDSTGKILMQIFYSLAIFLLICCSFMFKLEFLFILFLPLILLSIFYQVDLLSNEELNNNDRISVEKDVKVINSVKYGILVAFDGLLLICVFVSFFNIFSIYDSIGRYVPYEMSSCIYLLAIYILYLLPLAIIIILEKFFKEKIKSPTVLEIKHKSIEKNKIFIILFSLIFVVITILLQVIAYII